MFLFGDPLVAKNSQKHFKREYEREHGAGGSRRKLKRYYDEHPERKSHEAFLNLFPQVANTPRERLGELGKFSIIQTSSA